MRQRTPEARGALSLTLLASVASGCIFALLFANLVRYVLALHAVRHAAEAAARCLSPAGADCLAIPGGADGSFRDWFAVRQTEEITEWTDRYAYRATLYRQEWEARGEGFEVRLVEKPHVVWPAIRVPVATFRGALNQYEHRTKTIDADVLAEARETRYRIPAAFAAAGTNFPDFDGIYEVRLDQRPAGDWRPRVLRDRENPERGFRDFDELPMANSGLGAAIIPAGETRRFRSALFEVPRIPEGDSPPICVGYDDAACDIRSSAGEAGLPSYAWDRNAALALKLFAAVRRVAGEPSIAWAGAPGAEGKHWGLEVEILSAADYQSYRLRKEEAAAAGAAAPSEPPGAVRCLGGRSPEDVLPSQEPRFVNLWLRGPKGSNGGGDPNCPASQKDLFARHDAVYVERGGAYRVTAWLTAGGTGSVAADVTLRHAFDTYEPYEEVSPRVTRCTGTVAMTADESLTSCDAAAACPGIKVIGTRRCTVRSVSRVPLCLTDEQARRDPAAVPLPKILCGSSVTAAVCDPAATPSQPVDCSAELSASPERIVCGWTEETALRRRIELARIPAGCEAAEPFEREAPCDAVPVEILPPPDGHFGDPAACSSVADSQHRYAGAAAEINALRPHGWMEIPALQTVVPAWSSAVPASERWAPALRLPEELSALRDDPEAVRKGRFRAPNRLPVFRHRDGGWTPSPAAFGFYHLAPDAGEDGIEIVLTGESPVSVEKTYPFARSPELEIPEAAADGACGPGEALESRLRRYAGNELAAARDPSIVVETSASYVDTIRTARRGGCSPEDDFSVSLPSCTKPSRRERSTPVCADRLYLGRFDDSRFPDGPPVCSASRDLRCFSDPLASPGTDASPGALDLLAAARRGLDEIHRSFPGAALSCSGLACTSIDARRPDPDHVSVAVRFELPLTFPFREILGRDSLSLDARTTEMLESSVAGRFATARGGDDEVF